MFLEFKVAPHFSLCALFVCDCLASFHIGCFGCGFFCMNSAGRVVIMFRVLLGPVDSFCCLGRLLFSILLYHDN